MRFGLIGYGAWGCHHARVIAANPRAELKAIAARSDATRQRAMQEHPGAQIYADFRELLERSDLDAVAVVLPSHLHREVGAAVLSSGRHLLMEKPMAISVADCDSLLALAERNKKVLAIGHEMRLSSLWGKMKELISSGGIGEPLYALIELWRKPYRLGADGWRYDITRVGNWILEEPIHFFDLARWYFEDVGQPESVYARGVARQTDHPELEDNFSAFVNFPGGRYAVISQTLTGWEHHQVVKVTGTEGALWASWSGALDRTFTPTFSLKHARGQEIETVPIPRPAGEVFELEEQLKRFIEAAETGSQPAANGVDGKWAVQMCLRAAESVRSGATICF